MYRLHPNSRGKIRRIATQIIETVKNQKVVSVGKLAIQLGYNPHYLRYAIIPAVLEFEECLKLAKSDSITYLEWVCKEEGEVVE